MKTPVSSSGMATGPVYFELYANDPARAAEFYTAAFGWIFTKEERREPVEYWQIDTGGGRGGLLRRPVDHLPPLAGINAFVCSMLTEDFDTLSERLIELGARTVVPKFAIPGLCWQGYFADPEGNTFGIFEVDEDARREE